MISVRQATIDLFRTYGLTTWFGLPSLQGVSPGGRLGSAPA